MTRCFVDTNVFLCFLTDDAPEQAERAEVLFRNAADGKLALVTSVLVVVEIVWTLESYYGLRKQNVADNVLAILRTPGLEVEDADLLAQAATTYATGNVDFADAYHGAWLRAHRIRYAYTFDRKHFARMEDVVPLAPGTEPVNGS
jgi:predicted nucleic-acid-binding protein